MTRLTRELSCRVDLKWGFVLFGFPPHYFYLIFFIHVRLAFSEGPSETQVSGKRFAWHSHTHCPSNASTNTP